MTVFSVVLLLLIGLLGGTVYALFLRVREAETKITQILSVLTATGSTLGRKLEDGASYVGINGLDSWEDINLE